VHFYITDAILLCKRPSAARTKTYLPRLCPWTQLENFHPQYRMCGIQKIPWNSYGMFCLATMHSVTDRHYE